MKKIVLGVFLLTLWHAIILVNQSWGINVLLFTIPLVGFLVYVLKEKDLIKNKRGLLFIIPILVLSTTYFIYDSVWKYLNVMALPTIYILMYIFTIKPEYRVGNLLLKTFLAFLEPVDRIGAWFKETKGVLNESKFMKNKEVKVLKSILVVLPVVILVLLLLSSADMVFKNMFGHTFQFLECFSLGNCITQVIVFALLFFYLGGTIIYITGDFPNKVEEVKEPKKKEDPLTINLLLTVLNVIYIIFDIIQINSLLLHRVAENINYAEYARSGFFQLMVISFINFFIILISKKSEERKYTKAMSIGLILLTFIIIISSFLRMYLYEQAYGYTVLRLGVYTILVTEGLLLIPTIAYVLNSKVKIIRYYLYIAFAVYTFVNCFSIDRVITANNINRYNKTGKIDVEYLLFGNYDNLNQLRDLYEIYDGKEKEELEAYIKSMDEDNKKSIFGYNISKEQARTRTTYKKKKS